MKTTNDSGSSQGFNRSSSFSRKSLLLASLAGGLLFYAPNAGAQATDNGTSATAPAETEADNGLVEGDIVVTAQKRSESLQSVPIAITAIGTKKLAELQVSKFEDYARYLSNVSYQTSGPGTAQVFFRGVASGENANHSTSQPSVGVYLDEQPITTIQGALDVHVYDIARVESLAGPQGTLYGASSEAGTIRIITNKPELGKFYGEVQAEGNKVSKGGEGYVFESFVNAPISENSALRVVAWYKKDAGYIDNIAGSLTFPSSMVTLSNAALAKKDYNQAETYGGRAALKIDLNDDWTITPQIMGQQQKVKGSFAVESGLGDLQTMQFNPEWSDDEWAQAALTIEGKIANFDVTYAGSYLKRKVQGATDYSDYSYFYDAISSYGNFFYDNNGSTSLVSPNQYIQSDDRFTKQSHELRFTSPSDARVRVVGGIFYQRQRHNIEQNYIINNIADAITVPGTDSNIWLTKQIRIDRDYAAFGEVSFDITDKLTATAGGRYYKFKNSLIGFFGYSAGFSSKTGVAACPTPFVIAVAGSPCTNVDKTTSDTGWLYRANLTYKMSSDALVYATVSKGYRPGGINRRGSLPPYKADFIVNYELGVKTSWLDRKLRFNAAVYQLDWDDLQLSFLGANGLSEVRNAGIARVRGFEIDTSLRPFDGMTLSAGLSYNDAKITRNFCKIAVTDFNCSVSPIAGQTNSLLAPAGTRLPVTAKVKANAVARYEFDLSGFDSHLQLAFIHEGKRTTDLRTLEGAILGTLPAYNTLDFSFGMNKGGFGAELFIVNLTDERGYSTISIQCNESYCGDPNKATTIGPKLYRTPIQPRTFGVRFSQKF